MSTPEADLVTDFLREHRALQGHCLAYNNPNEPGNLWYSRINDGWWDQTDFWIEADAVMEWHEADCKEREKAAVLAALERVEGANFPEPCEPECDAVRHARHQGSWDHHLRVDEALGAIRRELETQSAASG